MTGLFDLALMATAASAQPAQPATSCTPEHAAMGHCTMPAPQPEPPPQSSCTAEHAAMGHCTMPAPPEPAPPPQSSCTAEHAAMGHCSMPAQPEPARPPQPTCTAEHAAMGHCTMPEASAKAAEGTDLPAGNAPPPPVPRAPAADAVFGTPAMEMGRHHLSHFHGAQKFSQFMLDTFEVQHRSGGDGYEWDAAFWYGGDIGRLWLKSEGEGEFGHGLESAELQALYSHAVGPYFNLQGGVRYDIRPDPSRAYAAIGFEGLAPYWFEVEGALFLSDRGELMARLEGSYDQRITQRLILQPSAELNLAAQSSRDIGVGKGLSDLELGLRLRYEISREFAPYVGVKYSRAFGDTRRFLKDEGEDAAGWSLLTGIRMWF